MFDVAYRMPKRPSDHTDAFPADVDLVLALALAKNREHRFDTAAAFAQAFATAASAALDAGLRRRARRLLEQQPWGTERTTLD
jgi:hypothetical protein